ncbi:MAG TPA: hypothetical protein VJT72_03500 [Pseudonocardiaceae bacterium]|nr:hypothetical protein [Pseudonocardiaceae bacterium]
MVVKELRSTGRVAVDVGGFELGPQPSEMMIFSAALAEYCGWPAAKIALCRPDPQMTHALAARRVSSLAPVYHLLQEAKAEIDRQPDRATLPAAAVHDRPAAAGTRPETGHARQSHHGMGVDVASGGKTAWAIIAS